VSTHPDDRLLSDVCDAHRVPTEVQQHVASCAQCHASIVAFRAIRDEATMLKVQTGAAPDIWRALAALTVHRERVRRALLRDLWRPFVLALLTAFALGIVATETFREVSRKIAATAARVAPTPSGPDANARLKELNERRRPR
jgi:hypothetical protein